MERRSWKGGWTEQRKSIACESAQALSHTDPTPEAERSYPAPLPCLAEPKHGHLCPARSALAEHREQQLLRVGGLMDGRKRLRVGRFEPLTGTNTARRLSWWIRLEIHVWGRMVGGFQCKSPDLVCSCTSEHGVVQQRAQVSSGPGAGTSAQTVLKENDPSGQQHHLSF